MRFPRTSRTSLYRAAFRVMAVVCVAAMLAGCGSDSNNNGFPQSRLRVINALTGTNQNVDVQVGGQTRFFNIPYGQLSTSVTVNAGNSTVNVLQAGTTNSVVSNNAVNIQQSVDELLLVSGVAGATAGAQRMQVDALSPIDLSNPPTNGQVRFYFINAAPFANTADFSYTVNGGPSQTNANLTGVPYLQMTPAQLPTFGSTVFTAKVGTETVNTSAFTTTGTKTYVLLLTGRPQTAGGNPNLGLQILPVN